MTQTADRLIFAKWIAPVDGQNSLLTDYGVAVKDERIIAIAPQTELKQQFTNATVTSLEHHLLIPGMVNAHTHLAMNLLKGYADDLPLMTWLNDHIWPAEKAHVSNEFVYQGTKLAIAELLKSGSTCFNDNYFMPPMTAEAAIEVGINGVVGAVVIDFPTAWANNADEYISKGLEMISTYRNQAGIHFSFAPHAPYTVGDDALTRIATLSQEMDLPIHMHVHETAGEVTDALAKDNERPISRLHRLGLLSPNFIAVHMTELSESDMQLVSETGTNVVHCPESNMKLASGIAPIPELLKRNINVALGTDGSASNNDLDMIGEMRSAALLAKVGAQSATAFSAQEALQSATINGAKALGIDHLTGSIEQGKQADLVAINMRHIATQPIFDPVAQLVYAASRDQISHVWSRGVLQVNEGELTRIDIEECYDMAAFWRQKISAGNNP